MRQIVSGTDVAAPHPTAVRAPRRHASDGPDVVGRCAGVGLLAGAVIGLYLGFASGGGALGRPVVIAVAGMLGGLVIGLVLGFVLGHRHHAPVQAEAPVAEPVPIAIPPVETASPSVPADPDHLVPPGWYPDPRGAEQQRYWDGTAWTTHLWSPRDR